MPDKKKQWLKPKLTVLVRAQGGGESILVNCKTGSGNAVSSKAMYGSCFQATFWGQPTDVCTDRFSGFDCVVTEHSDKPRSYDGCANFDCARPGFS